MCIDKFKKIYSIEFFLMYHYYITRSFTQSFTFFIIFEKKLAFLRSLFLFLTFATSMYVCILGAIA